MKTRKIDRKGIVRFTGGGALIAAMIGLIFLSPLSASGQDVPEDREAVTAETGGHYLGAMRAGPHRFGPGIQGGHIRMGRGMDIELMTIVLEMSDRQVEEVEKLLEEHQDKMDDRIAEEWKKGRRQARKNRVHRRTGYDRVRSDEAREKMRLERREEMRELREKMRDDLDAKLAGVLDDGQMKKLREIRELRDFRREEMRELREQRRDARKEDCETGEGRHERRGRGR